MKNWTYTFICLSAIVSTSCSSIKHSSKLQYSSTSKVKKSVQGQRKPTVELQNKLEKKCIAQARALIANRRFTDAREIITVILTHDPYNKQAIDLLVEVNGETYF